MRFAQCGGGMYQIDVKEISKDGNDLAFRVSRNHFQQTVFWGEFKARHGWNLERFEIAWKYEGEKSEDIETLSEGELSGKEIVSVMIRSFGKGLFSMAYVPLYPSFPFPKDKLSPNNQTVEFATFLNEIGLSLKPYLPKNTISVRFDPDVEFLSPEERDEFNMGMNLVSYADRLRVKKTKVDIQPPDSTQIDLTPDEEEILSKMKNKWRYNIHLAEKKGVEIEKMNSKSLNLYEKLDTFYDLYKITAERDGIGIHPKNYYADLITHSTENEEVSLYIAIHENDYLGAIITLFTKTESIYLYGCSNNVKRNLMPNFLLQWTAMKDAKAFGSAYYDMYGMPPTDDENHPMHGLYLFKTGFGGKNIHRIGSFDVRLSPLYKIATSAENARAWYHKVFKKKIRGR